jgi:metal-sulfur cluster biosynthetic enzyme
VRRDAATALGNLAQMPMPCPPCSRPSTTPIWTCGFSPSGPSTRSRSLCQKPPMPSHSSPFHRAAEASSAGGPPPAPKNSSRKAGGDCSSLKPCGSPPCSNDLVSLGMVRNLQVVGDYVYLRLYVGCHQLHLQEQVQHALGQLPWCKKAYAQLCTIPVCAPPWRCPAARGGGQVHHCRKPGGRPGPYRGQSRTAGCRYLRPQRAANAGLGQAQVR